MELKIIAFIGIDIVDTILYLSRICNSFGSNVLIADYSPSELLEYCIPNHAEVDMKKEIIDYRGVDYTKKELTKKETQNYDLIFLNLGFKNTKRKAFDITHKIYTTDMHKANVMKLYDICDNSCDYRQLVVRGKVGKSINLDYYVRLLNEKISMTHSYYHRYSEMDVKNSFQCEYNDKFTFQAVSNDFKDYLFELVTMLYPEESRRDIKKNIKRAERGE